MRVRRNPFGTPSRRKRRFSPLALIGVGVSLAVALVGTIVFLLPYLKTHAAGTQATPNMDCTLIVPAKPLTAQGLATPYQLVATNPDNGACNEANAAQAAFVQGSVFDPATGNVSVYNPLVIDKGTQAAAAPVVPTLPNNAIVALWFGFNGNNLTLKSSQDSLRDGKCVNGAEGSIFGQFAYCNAPAFFTAANQAIAAGKLTVPALGTAKDGKSCPTVRDFSVVDQDQSDNVTTTYLVLANGQTAQANAQNHAALGGSQALVNGSDNRLLAIALDTALGCTPWMAPDLANGGQMTTALALNELQAMVDQQAPVALVPLSDPMVLKNNETSLSKTNLYRAGVDQPRAQNRDQASPKTYCQNLVNTGAPRIIQEASLTVNAAAPDPAVGNTLFTFLAQRFVNSYGILNCKNLLGKDSPIATQQDGNGVAVSAMFNGNLVDPNNPNPAVTPAGNPNPNPTGTPAANPNPTGTPTGNPVPTGTPTGNVSPNCSVNGQMVQGCNGEVQVNGQTCKVTYTNNVVTMDCPTK